MALVATPTELSGTGPFEVAVEFDDGQRKYGQVYKVSSVEELKNKCRVEIEKTATVEQLAEFKSLLNKPLDLTVAAASEEVVP